MTKPIRIGNAQAFWGDRSDAPAEMLSLEPELDYLTLDYLAEVSLSILANQRDRDPSLGYARDFVEVVRSLAPYWQAGGQCRLISNAGGLNPQSCARACAQALRDAGGPTMPIGIVEGDDVLSILRDPEGKSDSYQNLDSGRPISDVLDRLVTANAYLGAEPIVEALAGGARIVITGRVADPSLTVAPCIHEFGWRWDDHDRIAGATIAGHLIECGAQVTGGISTDWLSIPDPAHIGFPIVEVSSDGTCVVTKPRGTGGWVNAFTVTEQLLYEIGDPDAYLSPDATVSFLGLQLEDLGDDRVRVTGARGRPAPPTYKVSATYQDGYRAQGMLTIFGRDAWIKAHRCGEIVLDRVREAGFTLREATVECLGAGDVAPGIPMPVHRSALREIVLRIAVADESRQAVERFSRELMPLITAGPPGTTGYAEGRPKVHQVFRYWPCLVERGRVKSRVSMIDQSIDFDKD
jgi:Acyclic terpene utilisation family protein AtuA